MSAAKHPNWHPLRILFGARGWIAAEGMNWLQAHGHISDNCIEPEDVALGDAAAICARAGALWALPSAFRLPTSDFPR